ncbi:MAG TPA: hypothetical protein VFZ68_07255 [Acidimicrobiales bacterium]
MPVAVPERSVRRTAVVPAEPADRATARRGLTLAAPVAIAAGAALAVVGSVALLRSGVDTTWYRPRVEVLDADHTALLAAIEIGVGLVLLIVGLRGWRIPAAILGMALALAGTAVAIEPAALRQELAVERWWAAVIAAAGVVLTLAALPAPRTRHTATVDVT